jgi:hypothetical protein
MTKAFERSSRRRLEPTAIFRAYCIDGRAKCDLHIFPLYKRNKIRAVHFMSLHNVIRHGLNWPSRARVPGKNNLDRTDSAAEPYFEKTGPVVGFGKL